jgi:hypothetical protein
MKMGGGGGNTTSTTSTKVELPAWYDPLAKEAALRGYDQSIVPFQQYPGQRIADLAPAQIEGLGMAAARAREAPVTTQATQQAMNTLSGMYLDPSTNPAWASGSDAITRAYREGVAPTRNALFSQAGSFGADNSAFNDYAAQQEEALGRSLGGLWGDIYGQERGRQIQALGLAPSVAQAGYMDSQNLIGVGDAVRQYNQDLLNLGYGDFLEQRDYPWQQLERFAGLAPGLLGNAGTTTSTGPNPYQTSPLAGAVGGGLLGYGASTLIPALSGMGLPLALGGALMGGLLS